MGNAIKVQGGSAKKTIPRLRGWFQVSSGRRGKKRQEQNSPILKLEIYHNPVEQKYNETFDNFLLDLIHKPYNPIMLMLKLKKLDGKLSILLKLMLDGKWFRESHPHWEMKPSPLCCLLPLFFFPLCECCRHDPSGVSGRTHSPTDRAGGRTN